MALKGTGLRIEGTREQIDDMLRRLGQVSQFAHPKKLYDSRRDADVKIAYVRCYSYDPVTLLNQLEAAHSNLADLERQLGEALLLIDQLREQLGLIPRPRLGDAVLSPKNKK